MYIQISTFCALLKISPLDTLLIHFPITVFIFIAYFDELS